MCLQTTRRQTIYMNMTKKREYEMEKRHCTRNVHTYCTFCDCGCRRVKVTYEPSGAFHTLTHLHIHTATHRQNTHTHTGTHTHTHTHTHPHTHICKAYRVYCPVLLPDVYL